MSKFGESGEIIFSLKVSKNDFSQVNLVKYVINGANFVKVAHFGENAQNRVILAYYGGKMTSYVNIFGK